MDYEDLITSEGVKQRIRQKAAADALEEHFDEPDLSDSGTYQTQLLHGAIRSLYVEAYHTKKLRLARTKDA